MGQKVDIIKDAEDKSIVVINDLRFKGRRSVDWNIVEECLKEYIGKCAEITETSDMVYIGAELLPIKPLQKTMRRNIIPTQNLAGTAMIHALQYPFMVMIWN